MAKKKSKKRRPQQRRPQQRGPAARAESTRAVAETAEAPQSRRAERKEEARKERERRVRAARRRQRNRKLIRWGVALAIVGGIVAIWWFTSQQSRELQQAAAGAQERVNASEVEEQDGDIPAEHTQPYSVGEGGVPSFGGNHTPNVLDSEPSVYQQPLPEETAIHNLEHGYVVIYYAEEGENALDEGIVSELEDLAESEDEVLMAPYPEIAQPLYLVAWGARQSVAPPPDADPQDVVLVAEAFIDEYRNGAFAPEAEVG